MRPRHRRVKVPALWPARIIVKLNSCGCSRSLSPVSQKSASRGRRMLRLREQRTQMRCVSGALVILALASCRLQDQSNSKTGPTAAKNNSQLEAGPVPQASDVPRARPEVPANCPLVVDFASYGAGVDDQLRQRVEALLSDDPAVRNVNHYTWGREGEVALCVEVASTEDAERLAQVIIALLPSKPRGPVHVSTLSGLLASSPSER